MIKIEKAKPKYSLRAFLYLIPLSISICIVGNILVNFIPNAADNEVSKEIYEMLENGKLFNAIIMVGIISPIIEELIFRFGLYALVNKFLGYKLAIAITTILFAMAHLNLEQGLYALFAGFFFGCVRYLYDSVWCTIFMHLLMNVAVLFFADYFVKGVPLNELALSLFIAFIILILSIYRILIIFKERRI